MLKVGNLSKTIILGKIHNVERGKRRKKKQQQKKKKKKRKKQKK